MNHDHMDDYIINDYIIQGICRSVKRESALFLNKKVNFMNRG